MAGRRTMWGIVQKAERTALRTGLKNTGLALGTLLKEIEKFHSREESPAAAYRNVRAFAERAVSIVNEERNSIVGHIESVEGTYSHTAYTVECSVSREPSGRATIHTNLRTGYRDAIHDLMGLIATLNPAMDWCIPPGTVIRRIDRASRKIRKVLHEINEG